MTLDYILNSALHTKDTKAVLLFDEACRFIAGRGDLDDSEIQNVAALASYTENDMTGQIALNDGKVMQFHHTDTHVLVLLKSSLDVSSPALTERAPLSILSTSVDTIRGSKPDFSTLLSRSCPDRASSS